MIMRFIPSVNPGDSVGSKPTFPVNAQVKGDFLYLRDANGNQIAGRSVSDGDEITVLKVDHTKQLALVQYPAGTIYRQGYVTNATSIIKYKNEYNWLNGSTPETVYDVDKKTQIGSLDPREKATILYKVDGMTALVYDTSKGKMTKSGLVHYAGSGGSTGGGDINGIAPGGEVPGGFTYPNNAQVVGDDLYLRDANGNQISGRVVSNGDKITVLDVGYTKQLALVQYPAGSVVRQGYVTNATNLIRYFKQGEWLNGSTTEPVLDENGGSLGSLSPYEAATPLYKKNGMTHVVYDTSKGPNTKSGYVKFEGLPELPDTGIQIPSTSHSQATVEVYGTSGKGRPLKVYKIGSGSKVLFAGFALHGWEDNWSNDGLALVNIANSLIEKIGDYKAQNGLHGWTVYIAPCMNPDGVVVKGTHNGPGRCAVTTRVDMNRCFPYKFSPQYISRNYTGPNPLGAPEAVALKNLVERINVSSSEMVVLDFHGWMNFTQGNAELGSYFGNQFGFGHKNLYSSGFFSSWATTLRNTKAVLIEYPTNTYSYNDVINKNYIGKTFNGIINILKNNPNGGDVDNGGSDSSEIPYNANGEVINVEPTSALNVRSGPGTTYRAIGTLKLGNRVTILAKTKPAGETKDWYKISFNYGSGYIRSDFVKLDSSEINYNAVGEIINVSSFLNVRSGPGTNFEMLGKLYKGDVVLIVSKNGDWYKIRYGTTFGYIHKDYVYINKENDNFVEKKVQIGAVEINKVKTIDGIVFANINQMLKGFCNNNGYTKAPSGDIIVTVHNFHKKMDVSKTLPISKCKLINGDYYYNLNEFISILGYDEFVQNISDYSDVIYKYVYIGMDDETQFTIHEALDALGFIPVVGDVIDGVNAIMYALEKDYLNAALSLGAIIPVIGSPFFKGGKYGFKIMSGFSKVANKSKKFVKKLDITEGRYVYRAIHDADLQRIKDGLGLQAKNPNGTWSLEEHIVRGSNSESWKNDRFISTSLDLEISRIFNSSKNLGIIKIDLEKVPKELIYKSYKEFPLYDINGHRSLAYEFSVWQQEISILKEIPRDAFEFIE
ncbi:SH3 domain-containing protein [Clostridium perfringens]|nr:SH3 domain-containing protein [Clostridium perfringens]EJT6157509.1 SH3 domain-containing protein [Clostridium perfringens]UBK59503.1 SH3 domain-containing protein [Clostridium perfringens]UBK67496.1 SH3 domain-containing protein [Clostridium perfringens]UBL09438.1 SH3 domain-containing protein [Clostridium perfringens]CAG9368252.1 bacteriocin [Clostridium perfringens]